jgi:hypothetical protein
VREVFVDYNTFNEFRVFNSTTSFGNDFNQLEIDILALKVSNVKDCFDG